MKKIKEFFHEVKKEISKVKWPTKKDMVKYSIATIVFWLKLVLDKIGTLKFISCSPQLFF